MTSGRPSPKAESGRSLYWVSGDCLEPRSDWSRGICCGVCWGTAITLSTAFWGFTPPEVEDVRELRPSKREVWGGLYSGAGDCVGIEVGF